MTDKDRKLGELLRNGSFERPVIAWNRSVAAGAHCLHSKPRSCMTRLGCSRFVVVTNSVVVLGFPSRLTYSQSSIGLP